MTRKYAISTLLLGSCLLASPAMGTTPQKAEQLVPAAAVENKLVAQTTADMKKAADISKKEIVAQVEGTDISMFELVRMMNRVASAFYSGVEILTPEINKEIRERAMDRLIFEELAIQDAIKQNMIITPEKIDKVIDETQKLYPGDGEYQKYLDERGITEEQLRTQIKRKRLLQGITGKEVYQKVSIDPKDVDRLYEDYIKLGKLKMADVFLAKEIFMLGNDDKAWAAAKAEELLGRLKAYDYDFGKLVLDGSFIVRKVQVKKDKLPVIFNAMKEMEVGEFSEVMEDGGTFHIFKVLKNSQGRDMTKEEARGLLEDRLAPYTQEKRKAAWMEELKKDAKITIYEDKLEKMANG